MCSKGKKTANIFTFKSDAIKPGNVKHFHPTLLLESKIRKFEHSVQLSCNQMVLVAAPAAAAARGWWRRRGKVSGQDLGVQVGYADGVRGFSD